VLTELKSTSAGKLFQACIILSQKKELRVPELYVLRSLYTLFCRDSVIVETTMNSW